jgi:hypothetical protein
MRTAWAHLLQPPPTPAEGPQSIERARSLPDHRVHEFISSEAVQIVVCRKPNWDRYWPDPEDEMSTCTHQQMTNHHDSRLLSQLSETLHIWRHRERAMSLFNSQHQNDRGIRWRGIAATAMVELLVLFALSFAVVRYVEWSSAANQAEFMMRSERVELLTPSRIHSTTSYSNATPSGSVRPPDASGS